VKDASFFRGCQLIGFAGELELDRYSHRLARLFASAAAALVRDARHTRFAFKRRGAAPHTPRGPNGGCATHTGVPSHPLEGMALPKGPKSFGCSSVFEA